MFHHLVIALSGAVFSVLVAWRLLGCGALLLAPLGASLASLALGIALHLRGRSEAPDHGSGLARRVPER